MKATIFFLASLASAASLTPPPTRRQSSGEPCAQIASAVSQATATPVTVSPQDALACLRSIPFNQSLAAEFVNKTVRYVNFQSTIEAIKNPPKTYLSRPFDILGAFDTITAKVAANAYASQFDFDNDILQAFSGPNDGHFYINGLCTQGIFEFSRPKALVVSISPDGIQEPSIYFLRDAVQTINNTAAPVSPITAVGGQPVADYMVNLTSNVPSQDPDARYNTAFPSDAQSVASLGVASGLFVENGGKYPGVDSVTVTFQNGSSADVPTVAFVSASFNFTSGEALFRQYCTPSSTSSGGGSNTAKDAVAKAASPAPAFTASPAGYPQPFIRDGYNEIAGYDLKGNYSDAVVLFVPTFEREIDPNNQSATVSKVAQKIISEALAANKSKIIIDVSGNPGGQINRGFDLFKLFFPNTFPYTATRFRNHEAATYIGRATADLNQSAADNLVALAYHDDVTPDQQHTFPSMEALFNGGIELGVSVSSLMANFNFSLRANNPSEIPIHGFGGLPEAFKDPPFAPENILIIGDGYCASTCTTFTNLMTNYGGVRSVAFGGRPNNDPNMQIMGGVRGGQSASWSYMDTWSQALLDFYTAHPKFFTTAEIQQAKEVIPLGVSQFPLALKDGSINFRNAYQEGAPHLPLQFDYQAASCRLYYTLENYRTPSTQWLAAYNAVWNKGGCVGGKQASTQTTITPGSSSPSSSPTPTSTESAAPTVTATASATQGTFTGAAAPVAVVMGGHNWLGGVLALVAAVVAVGGGL